MAGKLGSSPVIREHRLPAHGRRIDTVQRGRQALHFLRVTRCGEQPPCEHSAWLNRCAAAKQHRVFARTLASDCIFMFTYPAS